MKHLVRALCLALPALLTPLRAQIVFAPSVTTPADISAVSALSAGDVNGDGFADLAVAHGIFLPPGIKLGNGAGGFGAEQVVTESTAGAAVALADITGDGATDLLVGQAAFAGRLQVLPGLDDGTFERGATYAIPNLPLAAGLRLHAVDADADGDLDVVVVAVGTGGFLGEVHLLINDGAGGLDADTIPQSPGLVVSDALAADFDADEQPDVVVSGTVAGPAVQSVVFLGDGTGGFAAAATLPGGPLIGVTDLDVNGVPDIVLQQGDAAAVAAFLGAGDGQFTAGPVTTVTPFYDHTNGVADFDGDGIPDLQIGAAFPAEAQFQHGSGSGSFDPQVVALSFAPSTNAWYRLTADFDGDGRLDVGALLKSNFSITVPDQLMTAFNRTYPAAGPLLDLGYALKGSHGWPIQLASGSFIGGTPYAFALSGAPPGGPVVEFIGVAAALLPFKGGVLVPLPNLKFGPLFASPAGTLSLAGLWPSAVPSGVQLYLQAWFKDAPAPHGFGASSGARITTP